MQKGASHEQLPNINQAQEYQSESGVFLSNEQPLSVVTTAPDAHLKNQTHGGEQGPTFTPSKSLSREEQLLEQLGTHLNTLKILLNGSDSTDGSAEEEALSNINSIIDGLNKLNLDSQNDRILLRLCTAYKTIVEERNSLKCNEEQLLATSENLLRLVKLSPSLKRTEENLEKNMRSVVSQLSDLSEVSQSKELKAVVAKLELAANEKNFDEKMAKFSKELSAANRILGSVKEETIRSFTRRWEQTQPFHEGLQSLKDLTDSYEELAKEREQRNSELLGSTSFLTEIMTNICNKAESKTRTAQIAHVLLGQISQKLSGPQKQKDNTLIVSSDSANPSSIKGSGSLVAQKLDLLSTAPYPFNHADAFTTTVRLEMNNGSVRQGNFQFQYTLDSGVPVTNPLQIAISPSDDGGPIPGKADISVQWGDSDAATYDQQTLRNLKATVWLDDTTVTKDLPAKGGEPCNLEKQEFTNGKIQLRLTLYSPEESAKQSQMAIRGRAEANSIFQKKIEEVTHNPLSTNNQSPNTIVVDQSGINPSNIADLKTKPSAPPGPDGKYAPGTGPMAAEELRITGSPYNQDDAFTTPIKQRFDSNKGGALVPSQFRYDFDTFIAQDVHHNSPINVVPSFQLGYAIKGNGSTFENGQVSLTMRWAKNDSPKYDPEIVDKLSVMVSADGHELANLPANNDKQKVIHNVKVSDGALQVKFNLDT